MVPKIGFHPRKKIRGVFSSRGKGLILVNSLKIWKHQYPRLYPIQSPFFIGLLVTLSSVSNRWSILQLLSNHCRTLILNHYPSIVELFSNYDAVLLVNYHGTIVELWSKTTNHYIVGSLNKCWLYGDCRTIMGYPDPNHKVPQPMDMRVSHPHRTRLGWCHCCWSCALRYSPRCWARCVRRKMRREPRRRWWETRSELALLGRTSQGANGHCSNGGKWWTRIGSLTG